MKGEKQEGRGGREREEKDDRRTREREGKEMGDCE